MMAFLRSRALFVGLALLLCAAQAQAQIFMPTYIFQRASGGGSVATGTFCSGNATIVGPTTSFTITAANICTAAADRYVIIAVYVQKQGGGVPPTPTVTVGGAAMTAVATMNNGIAEGAFIFVSNAPVTTGTTANIVITSGGGNMWGAVAQVWSGNGLLSSTPTNTYTTTTPTTGSTIAISAGGFAVSLCSSVSASPTFSWSSLSKDTDTSQSQIGGAGSAHLNSTPGAGSLPVTCTPAGSSRPQMITAAFR